MMHVSKQLEYGVTLMHVTSHMDPDSLETEVEKWACFGNRSADRAAERVWIAFPAGTWIVWQALAKEHYAREQTASVMLTLTARIGATEVSGKGTKERSLQSPPQPSPSFLSRKGRCYRGRDM